MILSEKKLVDLVMTSINVFDGEKSTQMSNLRDRKQLKTYYYSLRVKGVQSNDRIHSLKPSHRYIELNYYQGHVSPGYKYTQNEKKREK